MSPLYNSVLFLFLLAASPVLIYKLLTNKKTRAGFFQKAGISTDDTLSKISASRPIWIHAVSVGETIAAIPLVKGLRQKHPDNKIVISTVTLTGYETARDKLLNTAEGVDAVMFAPYDIPFIVKKIVSMIDPSLYIVLETELWPNIFRILKKKRVPSMVVNGRISDKSFKGYGMIKPLIKTVLHDITALCMQSPADVDRIVSLGAPPSNVYKTGSIKFDQKPPSTEYDPDDLFFKDLSDNFNRPIFVAGSTHEGEEEQIADVHIKLKESFDDLLTIIAPRHPDRVTAVETVLNKKGLDFIKRSSAKVDGCRNADIIILDTIGELAKVYNAASVVFIGGSLVNNGGHNALEPSSLGKAVLFGPHMENFREIAALLTGNNGAIQVKDKDELAITLARLLSDGTELEKIGNAGRLIYEQNRGAVESTLKVADKLLAGTR